MKKVRSRLTYANVMSSLAVFLVLGGATALAAKKIGANELKANSVLTGKIKKEAVTTSKLKNSAVNTSKIGDGAVATAKLADGAITSGKLALGSVGANQLDANERSEVVAFSSTAGFDFVDTYNPATWSTAGSVVLPNGAWTVSAHVGVAIGSEKVHIACRLIQGGQVLSQSGTEGEKLGIIPSIDGISLQGTASAGQVTLTCGDSLDGTTAIDRTIIATRAGKVSAG